MNPTTKTAAIIGGGVIGGGWAARFALNGWNVNVFDPAPDTPSKVQAVLDNARASLPFLADKPLPEEGQLVFCNRLDEAVNGAIWIQESIPERLNLKHQLFAELQTHTKPEAIIASSTSGFTPTQLRKGTRHTDQNPNQIIVAHPYNPVYLLPVVEMVGGTENHFIAAACDILTQIGMKPVVIAGEIDAHIGDRLLEAVWREALWLIKDKIATTQEIDDIITHGFGLRWAQMGLFETYRLAGGEAGMHHFLAQFGPTLAWPWSRLTDVPELDENLINMIADQSDAQSGHLSIQELERMRDRNLVGFLKILKQHRWAAGQVLADWDAKHFVSSCDDPKPDSPKEQIPFSQYRTEVLSAWIDYNGHMTEFRYLQIMSEASDVLLAALGLDQAYLDAGCSVYTVETHIRHLAEAKLAQTISVSTQIISAEDKKVRLWHSCVTGEGVEVATGEQMWVHVDMKVGHATPFRSSIAERLRAMAIAHAALPLPDGAGRSVGERQT